MNKNIEINKENVDIIWKRYFENYRNGNQEELMENVKIFIKEVNHTEPFIYYILSKQYLIKHLDDIVSIYIEKEDIEYYKIIYHMIDGWDDFFIYSKYTLSNEYDIDQMIDEEKIEEEHIKCHSILKEQIKRILPFVPVGSYFHTYYKMKLKDYFNIIL